MAARANNMTAQNPVQVIAVTGLGNQLLAFSTRLAPRAVTRKIAGRLNAAK